MEFATEPRKDMHVQVSKSRLSQDQAMKNTGDVESFITEYTYLNHYPLSVLNPRWVAAFKLTLYQTSRRRQTSPTVPPLGEPDYSQRDVIHKTGST